MTESTTPDNATLLAMYQKMSLIKQSDEQFRAAIRSGKMVMPYYSPRGQEVIPSAISVCLTQEDYICTIYRGIHDMLAKGIPSKLLWAELAGKITGTCKGKGGPMHVTHPETGIMVTTGIVGSSMPIANGLALSSKIKGDKRVTIAYFGDGASNIGAFHESLNMASLWRLPVVFVCQNNGYAEHTKYANGTTAGNISHRGSSYQMPGITVDGNDPFAMWTVARTAIERARNGGGPTLIDAKTFRFHGHVLGDADSYMDKGEKAFAMSRDPVPLFRAWLVSQKIASEEQVAEMDAAIASEIIEAREFALGSADPGIEELGLDVYASEVKA